ncbi:MAG: hypothetical protein ACFFD2_02145 [Promethearchaeota archaeon]
MKVDVFVKTTLGNVLPNSATSSIFITPPIFTPHTPNVSYIRLWNAQTYKPMRTSSDILITALKFTSY